MTIVIFGLYGFTEMIKKVVKLSDIAEKTGVSTATVSMVLNGKGRISNQIRKAILDTAKDLGYQKLKIASGNSWGILLPIEDFWDNVWHFIKPTLHNILKVASEKNIAYSIIPVYTENSPDYVYQMLQSQNISSVFSFHYGSKELFEKLENNNIQVVVINNSRFQEGYYSICVDDFQGAYEGTKHLLQKKHRKIAYIDYPIKTLPNLSSDRFFGFLKAVEEFEVDIPNEWHVTVEFDDIPEMKTRIENLINQKNAPTAFFIHDDILANRIIHILGELGKRIPGDFSIVAPGDTLNYSSPEVPQITTMSINTGLMGKYAAEMMLERNQGKYTESHVLKIHQQLIIRGSTLSI